MSERKVINKYYPPDFDPSKIPRAKKPKNSQFKVRMMLPMSVRCNTCGEYLYKGKKFNARKETIMGEEYLNIKIFRFYMKCTRCSAEFTIKTDPQNSDYIAEMNCSRNFELWRENEKIKEDAKKLRQEEEKGDTMKALENRTLDSKIEMDIIEALDEIKSLNAKNAKIDHETLLKYHQQAYEEHNNKLHEEDEEELKSISFKNSNSVKRLIEEEDDQDGDEASTKKVKTSATTTAQPASNSSNGNGTKPLFSFQKRVPQPEKKSSTVQVVPKIAVVKNTPPAAPAASTTSLGLLGDYGEESD
jgi:hypothetical protein